MSFKRGNFGKPYWPFATSVTALNGMRQPLPLVFPEYSIVKHPQGAHEFRVETKSYFQSRSPSAPYPTGFFDYATLLVVPILTAVVWQMVRVISTRP